MLEKARWRFNLYEAERCENVINIVFWENGKL